MEVKEHVIPFVSLYDLDYLLHSTVITLGIFTKKIPYFCTLGYLL